MNITNIILVIIAIAIIFAIVGAIFWGLGVIWAIINFITFGHPFIVGILIFVVWYFFFKKK